MNFSLYEYDKLILYDTIFQSLKVICFRKKETENIECFPQFFFGNYIKSEKKINTHSNINAIFSFEEKTVIIPFLIQNIYYVVEKQI